MKLFVGLDHSLTAFGLVAIRSDWGLDLRRVRRATLTTKPGPVVPRRALLAHHVCEWIRRQARRFGVPLSAVRVLIEGGIFMRGKPETIRSQERLAGQVEFEVWRQLALELELVQQQTARATFMGSEAYRRGAGDAAQALMRGLVGLEWDEAELDAFVVANHGLSLSGLPFISCAPPVRESAPKRRKGRAA